MPQAPRITSPRRQLPYGAWPTPITSELVVRAAASLERVAVDGEDVWWSEVRPQEGGRSVLVRRRRDGAVEDVLPAPWNARTAAHEYGGGAWMARGGAALFADWRDQRLHRLVAGARPVAVTPEPPLARGDRYADGRDDVWVRERHRHGAEAVNELVRLVGDGQDPQVVATGAAFYSDPRRAPSGALCWLEWDHPNMPWDGTRLVVDGQLVAGGDAESISQPRWHPDGALWFISDRTGWWNLYRLGPSGVAPVVVLEAEIGVPQWQFGESRYDFLDDRRVVLAYQRDGFDHLAVWDGAALHDLDVPFTIVRSVTCAGGAAFFVGASATAEAAIVRVAIDGVRAGEVELLRPPRQLGLDPAWFSQPQPIEFESAGGRRAHALFYAPTSLTHEGPPGERPPLLVLIHGGPTSAARPALQLGIQYWTSRGFAVVDVNYGGSTGYGREYRRLLRGQWGIVDVEDCEAAARFLAGQGRADAHRLCIRGGSAGGYTTLAALAFRDTFAAGASHYGIADLEALAKDTHKFESRYLDGLIAPYPERRDVYVERSPIHHLDGFHRPLAVFQGLEDEVVPPNQAERIVAALRARRVPVAYVAFEGEQHGFRRAENIRAALDGELSFYAQVFGFELPASEGIASINVENL